MKIKPIVVAPVKFVRRHKTAVAVVVTATTCLYINHRGFKVYDEFLKENNMFDAFQAWTPSE